MPSIICFDYIYGSAVDNLFRLYLSNLLCPPQSFPEIQYNFAKKGQRLESWRVPSTISTRRHPDISFFPPPSFHKLSVLLEKILSNVETCGECRPQLLFLDLRISGFVLPPPSLSEIESLYFCRKRSKDGNRGECQQQFYLDYMLVPCFSHLTILTRSIIFCRKSQRFQVVESAVENDLRFVL